MTPIQVVTAEGNITPDYAAPGMVDELPSSPIAEQAAELDGSLAARVQAKAKALEQPRTQRVPVPPDDVWNGELVLVTKTVKEVKGETPVAVIAEVTDHLEIIDSRTGRWDRVDGWAALGRLMGLLDDDPVSVGEIIAAVCHKDEQIVTAFASQLLTFQIGRRSAIERILGEQ